MEYRSEPAKGCVLALGCGFIFWAVVLLGLAWKWGWL